jgi:endonuclease YncB( thermonuclease family)
MPYCHHCSRKIKEKSQFCPYCGKRLGLNIKEEIREERVINQKIDSRKENTGTITIILILIIAGIFLFALVKDKFSDPKISLNDSNNSCQYECCLEELNFKQCKNGTECIENVCLDLEYAKDSNVSYVAKVIDGDTIILESGKKVRLLGINTPEFGQACYENATKFLEGLLLNKEVILEKDKEDTDSYGRLLRYVIADNKNVNLEMIKTGFAKALILGENKKYEAELKAAEELAQKKDGCIWQKSSECKDCIGISYFHLNAEGDDCSNPNDEYITFKNSCKESCDITNWQISDEATYTYTFKKMELKSNKEITIKSGPGRDNLTVLFWANSGTFGKCPAIWNNDGDTVYLTDSHGKQVLEYAGF